MKIVVQKSDGIMTNDLSQSQKCVVKVFFFFLTSKPGINLHVILIAMQSFDSVNLIINISFKGEQIKTDFMCLNFIDLKEKNH